MMVHPAPFDMLAAKIIAATMFDVRYAGKESHASAFPELGINAADALTVAQTALGLKDPPVPAEKTIIDTVVVNPKLDASVFSKPQIEVASNAK